VKTSLRLITLSTLFALATACGGQSGDPQTADRTADLEAAQDGSEQGTPSNSGSEPASAGSETVGGGANGSVGGPVASGPGGNTVDPDTSVSDEPGSTPGSPGNVDPREPTGCVPEFDPSTSAGAAPCNFVAGGECFAEGADACACAGCAEDQCIILESYPAQARCQ
jgi:hypothetical protein